VILQPFGEIFIFFALKLILVSQQSTKDNHLLFQTNAGE